MGPEPIAFLEHFPIESNLSDGLTEKSFVVLVDGVVCEEGWRHVDEIGPVSKEFSVYMAQRTSANAYVW